MNQKSGLILITTLMLAACSSTPTRNAGGYLPGDGPGNVDPAKLAAVQDAVPRVEPLQAYANRPYEALGVRYVPLTTLGRYKERGIASWYGIKFDGQRTSDGEIYNMYAMTAAHKTLPIPSYAKVTNLENGRSVIVRVNDRGPFMRGRIIDVSYAAAYKLGMIGKGSARVEVESLVPGPGAPAAPTVAAAPVQPAPVDVKPIMTVAVPAGTVFLQLGAFRSTEGAQSFLAHMQDELGDLGKQVLLSVRDGLTRVRLGPYRTADEARASAERLAPRLGFKPFISAN
jgi:rare lipoprotein A